MKMQKILAVAFILFLIYLAMPFAYLFMPAKIRDYVYREVCYHTIADNIGSRSKEFGDLLKNTTEFIYKNIDSHYIPATIDDTSWNCMVRGYGFCDQQAWALATLLSKKGIPARMAMLKGNKAVSGHTVSEVFIDDDWRVVDPHVNTVYYNEDGEFATLKDIQTGRVDLSPVLKEGFSLDTYRGYFEDKFEPERWAPLTEKQGVIRKMIFSPVYLWYKILGRKFSCFYQDMYLAVVRPETASRQKELLGNK